MADVILQSAGTVYDPFAKLAIKLITKFGKAGIILRTPPGAYSTGAGRSVSGPVESYTCNAVMSQWTFLRQPTLAISEGSQRILMSAQDCSITPNPEIDVLEWGTFRMKIVSVQPIAPGAIPVAYDMECKATGPSTYIPNGPRPFEDVVLDRARNTIVLRDGETIDVRDGS